MAGNLVLSGPIVRRVEPGSVSVFVATRKPCTVELVVHARTAAGKTGPVVMRGSAPTIALGDGGGAHAVVVTVEQPGALAWGASYHYDLHFTEDGAAPRALHADGVLNARDTIASPAERLVYLGEDRPGFVVPPKDPRELRVLHGSCRMPHGNGGDAMPLLDQLLDDALHSNGAVRRPQQLFLTGDQIYADDVDPVLLAALRTFAATAIGDTEERTELADHAAALAPRMRSALIRDGAQFTTGSGSSHLVTLAEFYAMYLFVWSREPWPAATLNGAKGELEDFVDGLRQVRRALANIATYMIFDDHEVTDDWNIRESWAQRAYATSLGRRVLRNALASYAVFQHWGNDPVQFKVGHPGGAALAALDGWSGLAAEAKDLDAILPVPTDAAGLVAVSPRRINWSWHWHGAAHHVIGLDTRTRRGLGPSELSLMTRLDIDAVLAGAPPSPVTFVLSAAPILGVEALEDLQRLDPIERDDESWAHAATYRHFLTRLLDHTPVIALSGDVHFGFGGSFYQRDQPEVRVVNFVSSPLKNMAIKAFERIGLGLLGAIDGRELQAAGQLPDGVVAIETRREVKVEGAVFVEELLIEADTLVLAPASAAVPVVLQAAQIRGRTTLTRRTNVGEIYFTTGADGTIDHVVQQLRYHDGSGQEQQRARCWIAS